MKITRLVVLAAALILAISVAASASGRYKLTLLNNSAYYPSYTGTIWTSMYQSKNVSIGPVYIQVYDTVMKTTTNASMLCVDLLGEINWGTTWDADIAIGTPTTVVNDSAWDRVVYMVQHNSDVLLDTKTNDDTSAMKIDKAALQVAVWETIRDGNSWNITKGTGMGGFALGDVKKNGVYADKTGIVNQALAYYNDADANATQGAGSTHGYYLAVDPNKQDLIFFDPGYSPPPPVPEVPTMLLGSIGLTMIGVIRRKVAKH